MKPPPKVFLSYAREWRRTATRIHADLKAAGCQPWIDNRQLRPGEAWHDGIVNAIASSDVFVACLSRHFGHPDRYSTKEIETVCSCERAIPVIPIKLEPEAFVPEQLRALHWDDYFQPGGINRLLEEIARHTAAELTPPITTLNWTSSRLTREDFSHPLIEQMSDIAEKCLARFGSLRPEGLESQDYREVYRQIRSCLGDLIVKSKSGNADTELDIEVTCLDGQGRYVLHPWEGIVGMSFSSQWSDPLFVQWVLKALEQHLTGYLIWTDQYHSNPATEAEFAKPRWEYKRKTLCLFSLVHVSSAINWHLAIEGHETIVQRLRA